MNGCSFSAKQHYKEAGHKQEIEQHRQYPADNNDEAFNLLRYANVCVKHQQTHSEKQVTDESNPGNE